MKNRKTVVTASAIAIFILMGVLAGSAVAYTTTNWSTWRNFSSSGTSLCAQDKAGIDVGGVSTDWDARSWERTLDTNCSYSHSRPANYTGAIVSLWSYPGGGSARLYAATAWQYNTSAATSKMTEINSLNSLDCDLGWRTDARGREWDSDTDTYTTDSDPVEAFSYYC